ncbi:hypothetical protein ACFX14_046626 [Malus domestica]
MFGALKLCGTAIPRDRNGLNFGSALPPGTDQGLLHPGVHRGQAAATTASLYEVLRVTANASPTKIKSAYRSLAKQYHPNASWSQSDDRISSRFWPSNTT